MALWFGQVSVQIQELILSSLKGTSMLKGIVMKSWHQTMGADAVFQLDNARIARIFKQFIQDIQTEVLPALSLDLKPIENVGDLL